MLVTMHGMMDEQFLVGLSQKVHPGQEGRVLKGLNPGSRCYRYKNVPIEDPTRHGIYGRLAVEGVRCEILPTEAAIVRRMFGMYADGYGFATIAGKKVSRARPASDNQRVDASELRIVSEELWRRTHDANTRKVTATPEQVQAEANGLKAPQ